MMPRSNDPYDIENLFEALFEGEITPPQARHLDALLVSDPRVRRRYVEYAQLHCSLAWQDALAVPGTGTGSAGLAVPAGTGSTPPPPIVVAPPVILPGTLPGLVAPPESAGPGATGLGGPSPTTHGGGSIYSWPALLAVLAMFAVGTVLGVGYQGGGWLPLARGPAPADHPDRQAADATPTASRGAETAADSALPTSVPFATLVKVSGCRWGAGTLPTQTGSRLSTGLLRLDSGKAQITFDNGARLYLESPAVFYLHGPSRAHLQSGKLVAHVPPQAIGFTIETQRAEIVDLGTEFGVSVEPGGDTEVHVLDGEVELGAGSAPSDPRKRLVTPELAQAEPAAAPRQRLLVGEARRISSPLGQWQAVDFMPEPFRGLLPAAPSTPSSPWHRLVSDNFDDNLLDPDKWRVVTSGIPQGTPQVREVDGRIVMIDRGHLVTTQQFDPDRLHGLRITGQWTFLTPDDMFEVVLRTDAVPGGEYGDTVNGVYFAARMERGTSHIGIFGQGRSVGVTPAFGDILINPGDVFNFEILDVPGGMSLRLWEASGSGAAAHVHTTAAEPTESNYITFHNRNRQSTVRVAYLDDVVIEQGNGRVRMNAEGVLETIE